MKQFSIFFLISAFIGTSITSCVKEKNFPTTPVIEFKQYIKYGLDSADCIIKFKDGDGDIGIVEGDTVSIPDLIMKYLYKGSDNLFHPFDAIAGTAKFDTLFYPYSVPDLTPKGQFKALDGEIKIKLRSAPLYYYPYHKTIKFEITLRDRSGHLSNMVSTDEITLP